MTRIFQKNEKKKNYKAGLLVTGGVRSLEVKREKKIDSRLIKRADLNLGPHHIFSSVLLFSNLYQQVCPHLILSLLIRHSPPFSPLFVLTPWAELILPHPPFTAFLSHNV
jgi:hypothetical protein